MGTNIGLGGSKTSDKFPRGIVGIVILVLTLGFVSFILYGSFAKPSYSFSDNNLSISGQFGVKINLAGATAAHELSKVPATGTKTNGAAIANIEKGYFKMGGSDAYLNVMDENASDYILITDKNGSKYYINCASSKETDSLYKQISEQNISAK